MSYYVDDEGRTRGPMNGNGRGRAYVEPNMQIQQVGSDYYSEENIAKRRAEQSANMEAFNKDIAGNAFKEFGESLKINDKLRLTDKEVPEDSAWENMGMSQLQRDIRVFLARNGESSIEEIAEGLGVVDRKGRPDAGKVKEEVSYLISDGYIEKTGERAFPTVMNAQRKIQAANGGVKPSNVLGGIARGTKKLTKEKPKAPKPESQAPQREISKEERQSKATTVEAVEKTSVTMKAVAQAK